MSPVSGAVEWVSPDYVELWLEREACNTETIESPDNDEAIPHLTTADESVNTAKINKLENEVDSLRKAVDNVIRTNGNKKLRNSREKSTSYSISVGSSSSSMQQLQMQIQRRKPGEDSSRNLSLDIEYMTVLERTLLETQEQV
jgi:hypothetical protein